ncbi:MAG TPA: SBBP repeat-containing protein [Luteitalea sp.]|nr:SBBP repeat-containing protein [Luteitalea sp.]
MATPPASAVARFGSRPRIFQQMTFNGSRTRMLSSRQFLVRAALTSLAVTLVATSAVHTRSTPTRQADHDAPAVRPAARQSYGQLPLQFEVNQGQAGPGVEYIARGAGYRLELTGGAATLHFDHLRNGRRADMRMRVLGAALAPRATGVDATGLTHYYTGADAETWREDIRSFARVRYAEVLPGVDVVYYGNQRRLEYDFIVAAGTDWRDIRLAFDGADAAAVDAETGDLLLTTADRVVHQPRPVAYQDNPDGTRRRVDAAYRVDASGVVAFEIGTYDQSRPLVIDPVIVYSTFLGGGGDDTAYDVAVDAQGNAYVVGETRSGDFPRSNAHQNAFGGSTDVFVARLNPAGSGLVYATFLGGSAGDHGANIALDPQGNAYITGRAGDGFPTTTGAFQTAHGANGGYDAFVAKLSPTGTLVYSTFLGGSDGVEEGFGIAVGPDGSAYVVGSTRSRNFPMKNAMFPTHNGYYSDTALGFLAQLNPAGTELVYSTYLGRTTQSAARGVAVDATGAAYVAGWAGGVATGTAVLMDFPTFKPFRPGYNGGPFVAKVAPGGGSFVYSTVIGDPNGAFGLGAEDLAIDAAGNAYITGGTSYAQVGNTLLSPIPMVGSFEPSPRGRLDGFIVKVSASGDAILYSSYLGGTGTAFDNGNDMGRAITVDAAGRAYVVGYSNSPDFPEVNVLPPATASGPWDAFITRFDANGCALGYSTLFGGSNTDDAFGVAVDAQGNAYVVGDTASGDFPVSAGALQTTHRGGNVRNMGGRESDAFVMKLAPGTLAPALSNCDRTGIKQDKPVLPTQTRRPVPTQPPIFRFFDQSALWFDPPIATGFSYKMTDAALFTAILNFPAGVDADNTFTVSVDDVTLGQFGPGQPVRFSNFAAQLGANLVNGVGVKNFQVTGIDPARESEDPQAFPIQLEFDLPRGTFEMQALTGGPVAPPVGTVQFTSAAQTVFRGTGAATLTLTRTGAIEAAGTVNFATANGTATAGSDYTATTGTATFAAGQATTTVMVPVANGTGNAATETFTVTLSAPSTGLTLGASTTATVSLLDNAGLLTRYFAEGATSAFFDTRVALVNPAATAANVLLTFQRADGVQVHHQIVIGAGSRATVRPATLAGLAQAEFSTVVQSDRAIVADRTMQWDANGYGSHAETSIAAPATRWHFAEGATGGSFDLFYLVQNPGTTAADVDVTYLLPAPQLPIVKRHTVAAGSRLTIWVDQEDPALANAEIGATFDVTNGVPVIVERSMYLNAGGTTFAGGTNSAGITTPATTWMLAEGATGAYFDLFVLVANPGDVTADVEARFLLPDGQVLTRSYAVPARSRFNIWVDLEDPALADTAVSTIVTSTNGVPVVVERAMWWPGQGGTWHEGHVSAGATAAGPVWVLAEGEVGGPSNAATYVLVANTSTFAGSAKVTLYFEDGTSAVKSFPVAATSRLNVDVLAEFPVSAGRRFGAKVESEGATRAQLVVERAIYSDALGVRWSAGSNALGTLIPPQ